MDKKKAIKNIKLTYNQVFLLALSLIMIGVMGTMLLLMSMFRA